MCGDSPHAHEAMSPCGSMWMTPPTSQPRKRPADIYTGMPYLVGDESNQASPWGNMSMPQVPTTPTSLPTNVSQNLLPLSMSGHGGWNQSSCGEIIDFQGLDNDGPMGQAYHDEAVPIIDLRYSNQSQDAANFQMDGGVYQRRMSGSSLTISTSGPLSDVPSSYDDFSTAVSEACTSDYLPTSNRTSSMMSSVHMSPGPSPRTTTHGRPEQVRAQSRGCATPSPRPSVRSAPYSLERSRSQRWSPGSQARSRRHSPLSYDVGQESYGTPQSTSFDNYPPLPTTPSSVPPMGFPGSIEQQHLSMPVQPMYPRHNLVLAQQMPSQGLYQHPAPVPSHGMFRMLQSNGDPHTMHGHYTDLSAPPNLFAALQEEQIPPPEEDMNPSDPNMVPYEQDLRFEGDLYTPKWVRGHGNKREGWCGICKPGRWLVLKNSAYWYDKSFTHGISAATGSPFEEPLDIRRMDGNPDVWEGLCGSCSDWIPLVSSKKKGTTWFRHAYKCHAHQKVKDMPKRRRETSQNRNSPGQVSKVKQDSLQAPVTPQMSTLSASGLNTPLPTPTSAPTSAPMSQYNMKLDYRQPGGQHHQAPSPVASVPEPLRLSSSQPPSICGTPPPY